MYDGATFPASHSRPGEMDNKPPGHAKALAASVGFDLRKMARADLDRVKSFYYGMISLNDKYVGQILEELRAQGLDQRTIVVFNADHGEMLGDHGLLFKGCYMYEEVLRIPLIIRAPGKLSAGTHSTSLTEEIDVMPTILDLLGLPAPAGIQGKSLAASNPAEKSAVFAEFPTIHAVRTKQWKLVRYLRSDHGELYDLANDPNELHNLWDDAAHGKRRAEMLGLLMDWWVASQDPLLAPVTDA